jgi:pyridoxamine 5'-phosphate oxidase
MTPPDTTDRLDAASAPADPFVLFGHWYRAALATDLVEPTAVTLATADARGRPDARTVLLKAYDTEGFVFYTNYTSRKGIELDANPWATLLFWWPPLLRQVRVEGAVTRVADAEAETYFATRPRGSQLGAWASPQSAVIPDRAWLDDRFATLAAEHADAAVPRPSFWGGYRVAPTAFEFWQGRADRLHDRVRYLAEDDGWRRERLAP